MQPAPSRFKCSLAGAGLQPALSRFKCFGRFYRFFCMNQNLQNFKISRIDNNFRLYSENSKILQILIQTMTHPRQELTTLLIWKYSKKKSVAARGQKPKPKTQNPKTQKPKKIKE